MPQDPPTRIPCPKDGTQMEPVTVGGIEIEVCRGCGCIWLDALERDRLLAIKGAAKQVDVAPVSAKSAPPTGGPFRCPRDHAQLIHMVDLHQAHIHFESCKVCGGMLFDAGELADLSEFTLRERIKDLLRI